MNISLNKESVQSDQDCCLMFQIKLNMQIRSLFSSKFKILY